MPFSRTVRWLAGATVFCSTLLGTTVASAETLSADEAVRLAAKNNPSLKAALLDARAAAFAVRAEEAARGPTFAASTEGQYAESFNGTSRNDAESVKGSAAVRYTTDIGTAIEGGLESNAVWRNINAVPAPGSLAGPIYGADLYFTARQPLLRGGGTDVNLAPLVQARSAQTQAERVRDVAASQTTLNVLSAYWELWYADQAVKVQETALSTANQELAAARTKADTLGTASQVDVLQFATSKAQVQDALSQARATRASRAIALGQLLGMAPDSAMALSTVDAEPTAGAAPSVTKLKAGLLSRSNELAATRAQIESGESRVAEAEDADQPKLDLYGKVSMGGVWATDDAIIGMGLPGGRPAFTVLAGLELEVPMGESRATSDVARARTQLDASKARYQAQIDALNAEVATLEVQLDATKQQVALSQQTAEMAGTLAAAEREKLALGTSSSSDVVKADQTAREAQLRRLRALVNQVSTQFQLEHDAGALLDRYGKVGGKAS